MKFLQWLRAGLAWRLKRLTHPVKMLLNPTDLRACMRFLRDPTIPISFAKRFELLFKYYRISLLVASPHRQWEILTFATEILRHEPGSIFVEAGCFKGASTAKFSLAADLAGSMLVVFDSFEGIPENAEPHQLSIFGQELGSSFVRGTYAGSLDEVTNAVREYGVIGRCEFVKGWFNETMPHFKKRISGAYVDVDLASSTKTCIENLFPLLNDGDCLISQDGHIPLVIEVFRDDRFWREQVGVAHPPKMGGVGCSKIVRIQKAAAV